MNGRFILGALVALLVAGGAAALGIAAYQAGVAQGVAQSAAGTSSVVYYGIGHGAGFGFGWLLFGFLGFLLLLLVLGAIFRASARHGAYGRWGGPGPWGGPGRWGVASEANHDRWRGTPWEARAREVHDEWHRGAAPAPTSAPERSGPDDPAATASAPSDR